MIHQLKTWPKFFAAISDGTKTFEVRRNDRDFKVGDALILQEFDPDTKNYSGREVIRRVTYLTEDPTLCLHGFCIMGLKQ